MILYLSGFFKSGITVNLIADSSTIFNVLNINIRHLFICLIAYIAHWFLFPFDTLPPSCCSNLTSFIYLLFLFLHGNLYSSLNQQWVLWGPFLITTTTTYHVLYLALFPTTTTTTLITTVTTTTVAFSSLWHSMWYKFQ